MYENSERVVSAKVAVNKSVLEYHQFDTSHLHLLDEVERANEETKRYPVTV